ncbi:MAG: tetratricopeptide repeat protein, partial [Fuerstiella sp.]
FRQKKQEKAALMAYLHVDVLYPGEPAQHAEALLRLSQLWGPGGHKDRAADASTRLTERYPNSQWAKQSGG